ncbi:MULTISPECIES: hypothetical protein [unclassified Microbacterium]|uniref:hypothetical protein n=1 Tax=unclassified Microbacterium TaxID=2609290 RepID=UPI00214CD7D1|nr:MULTISPECIES: hypothetical protein [unclassified Microbacterium]MCR2785885.1 hypothetical protein [Microbacterium sp. zg.B96]MDL5349998.1 hypothetical protein [Microbacterium sp. zg-YB36]WIM17138.1 hypothetical protein QNO11_05750 [Microbacterium sp. zg-B96]
MNALPLSSVATATALPSYTPRPTRRLEVVAAPQPRRRPRRLYGIIAVAGAVAIGAVQMGLSILTTQGSYEVAQLTREQRDLTYQKQILTDDVAGLNSPQFLAANASALGMVIAESPSYLRLSDGAVLGTGAASLGGSTIDALGRASVPNALIAEAPLVTAPSTTIGGAPVEAEESAATAPDATAPVAAAPESPTPPPVTDGLPVPRTH